MGVSYEGFKTPDWAKGAIMYHIFVDRYKRSNELKVEKMPNRKIHENWNDLPVLGRDEDGLWNVDFFCGNFKGIIEEIDYIKSLGTKIIYLSPIVQSQSNHRYDTADYETVDPYLGKNEDLKELCDIAHENGMYVVLDAVFNHTGNDSKYFNQFGTYDTVGAYQSKESPYYDFYRKYIKDGNESFEYWWDMVNLPVCNGESEVWKNYILGENGVIDKWFELGIDGLRLDVADELTDEFIEGIRVAVHRNKEDGLIIGEVWKNPMHMNRGYISSGKGMDSVMNYFLIDAIIRYYKYTDCLGLKTTIEGIMNEYPTETIHTLMNFTSTHDISRLIEICGCDCFKQFSEWSWNLYDESDEWIRNNLITEEEYQKGKWILKSYVTALVFMPGIFSIFYGDEVGLRGKGNLRNRATFPWDNQDEDLKQYFKEICNLKKSLEFMNTADIRIVDVNEKCFMFERFNENESCLILVSRYQYDQEIFLPEEYKNGEVLFKLPNCNVRHIAAYGALVIKKV